jgi:3-oxoadipate CoA-transferase beta subunit
MATAAETVVAQVREIVEPARSTRRRRDPGHLRRPGGAGVSGRWRQKRDWPRSVAADIPPGSYVNLGIGQPTLVADHLPRGSGVVLHTENGMLGWARRPQGDEVDWDLINAGKIPVTETARASYFHHADSFAMMRGGHLDVCVLGAFQVSVRGDLANWHTGDPDAIPAVGGAMDLAIGAREV